MCSLYRVFTFRPKKLRHIFRIHVLIYHLTYIYPSMFSCKANMIFEET